MIYSVNSNVQNTNAKRQAEMLQNLAAVKIQISHQVLMCIWIHNIILADLTKKIKVLIDYYIFQHYTHLIKNVQNENGHITPSHCRDLVNSPSTQTGSHTAPVAGAPGAQRELYMEWILISAFE